MRISIQTKGVVQAQFALKKWEKAKINQIKRLIAKYAELIQAQAQALAPVNDGNLRDSITVKYYRDGLAAEIRVGAEYGIKCMSSLLVTAG